MFHCWPDSVYGGSVSNGSARKVSKKIAYNFVRLYRKGADTFRFQLLKAYRIKISKNCIKSYH